MLPSTKFVVLIKNILIAINFIVKCLRFTSVRKNKSRKQYLKSQTVVIGYIKIAFF